MPADALLTQLILDTAMNAFVSMDTDGRITEWNRSAERMFGHSKADVVGRLVSDVVIPARYREAHTAGLKRFLASGEGPVLGQQLDLEALHAGGSEFAIEMTIRALEHAGNVTFHAFIADVTARREAENALQRANAELRRIDELKSQFLAMASHELRTPLTAIEGFTSTMLHRWDQISDHEKVRFLGIVDDQSRRLSGLVEDLLTLSHVESGKLRIDPTAVNVSRVAQRVLGELGVENLVSFIGAENIIVLAEDTHVTQILVNFISNAVKYGEPPIELSVTADETWVELCVADSGPGVPEDFAPHLFDAFARARHDVEAPHGTGLGLSIVRGLAHAYGGEAWYEPNQPTGSTFKAKLPRAASANAP